MDILTKVIAPLMLCTVALLIVVMLAPEDDDYD